MLVLRWKRKKADVEAKVAHDGLELGAWNAHATELEAHATELENSWSRVHRICVFLSLNSRFYTVRL